MEDSYFLILADQNLRPAKQHLKKWGAFFTGIGYAIAQNHEAEAAHFCRVAGLKIYKQPLPPGSTFTSFEQSHKTAFFKDRLIFIKSEISILKKELEIEEEDFEKISSLKWLQDLDKGKRLLKTLYDFKELQIQLKKSENFEKALSLSFKENKPKIQFISERPVNLLMEDAAEIPKLINYWDGSIQRPFLRKGILAMLVGAGGVGKTSALAQLALSIASGYPWLGLFPIEKPGSVFLGLGENRDDDIHRLLRKAAKHFMNPKQEVEYPTFFDRDPLLSASERIAPMSFSGINATFIQNGNPTPYFESLLSSLIESEPQGGWSCIILDPISRFIGMEAETDNASATQFISLLEKMSSDLKGNPTIIFGHHMNKLGVSSSFTNQSAARGSSALTDGVRWQVNLERASQDESSDQSDFIFRHVKSNFTALLKKHTLRKDLMGCFYPINTQTISTDSNKTKDQKKRFVKLGLIGETSG